MDGNDIIGLIVAGIFIYLGQICRQLVREKGGDPDESVGRYGGG